MTQIAYPHAGRTQGERRFGDRSFPDPYEWLADANGAQAREWLAGQASLVDALIAQHSEFGPAKSFLRSFPPAVPPCRVDAVEAAGFMPARYGKREFFIRRDFEGHRAPFCLSSAAHGAVAIHAPPGARDLFPSPSGRFLAFVDGVTCGAGILDLDHPEADCVWIKDVGATHICWWPDERGIVINSFAPPGQHSEHEPSNAGARNGLYSFDLNQREVARILGEGKRFEARPLVPLWIADGRLCAGVQDYWSQEIRGLFWLDLESPQRLTMMIEPDRHSLMPVGLAGDRLILLTSESRGFASIVSIRCDADRVRAEELAVLTEGVPVRYIPGKPWGQMSAVLGGHIYVASFEHTQCRVRVFGLDGADLGALPLPEGSGVDGLFPCPDNNTLRVAVQSYLHPPVTLEFEGHENTGVVESNGFIALAPPVARMLSECEQVSLFAPSSDGVRIPLSLVRSKNGGRQPAPLLLYIYGGFGNIWQPAFAADVCLWLASGGSYVQAHIRGDGVYGKAWHDAAAPQREIAIADIAAVRDFLVAEGHTSAGQVVIKGESNGGLMALAAMVRHPDEFAGCIATMPLADPIAHLLERDYPTLTRDLGDPKRNPEDLARMLEWAPGYNLRDDVRYPPLFLAVGDLDSVILPQDSYRFVAELQNPSQRDPLALLRVVRGHGHQRWFGDSGHSVSAEMFVFARMVTGQIEIERTPG